MVGNWNRTMMRVDGSPAVEGIGGNLTMVDVSCVGVSGSHAEACDNGSQAIVGVSWSHKQPTSNQVQYGHLHRCSLCTQQTPKSPPKRSHRGGKLS